MKITIKMLKSMFHGQLGQIRTLTFIEFPVKGNQPLVKTVDTWKVTALRETHVWNEKDQSNILPRLRLK